MRKVRRVEKQDTACTGRRPDQGDVNVIVHGWGAWPPGCRESDLGFGLRSSALDPAFELLQAVGHGPGQGEPELLGLGGWHGSPQWTAGWGRDQYRSRAPDFAGLWV